MMTTSYDIAPELLTEVDEVARNLEVPSEELITFFILDGCRRLETGEVSFTDQNQAKENNNASN